MTKGGAQPGSTDTHQRPLTFYVQWKFWQKLHELESKQWTCVWACVKCMCNVSIYLWDWTISQRSICWCPPPPLHDQRRLFYTWLSYDFRETEGAMLHGLVWSTSVQKVPEPVTCVPLINEHSVLTTSHTFRENVTRNKEQEGYRWIPLNAELQTSSGATSPRCNWGSMSPRWTPEAGRKSNQKCRFCTLDVWIIYLRTNIGLFYSKGYFYFKFI